MLRRSAEKRSQFSWESKSENLTGAQARHLAKVQLGKSNGRVLGACGGWPSFRKLYGCWILGFRDILVVGGDYGGSLFAWADQ